MQWNGVGVIASGMPQEPLVFYTNASGGWGCGAVFRTACFQLQWPTEFLQHISFGELVPTLISCMVWGKEWYGQRVVVHYDNEAVVHVVLLCDLFGCSEEKSGAGPIND